MTQFDRDLVADALILDLLVACGRIARVNL